MKVKNKDKVVEALEDCILFINNRLFDKNVSITKDKKIENIKKPAKELSHAS